MFLVSRGHASQRMVRCRRAHRVGAGFEGARPPAEKWPTVQRGVGRWRQEKSSKSSPPKPNGVPLSEHKPSRAPELASFADAVDEVKRLEAAIEVLGGDNVHTKGLQHCVSLKPKPEWCRCQSEWKHASCFSNEPTNGFSEPWRLSTKLSRRAHHWLQ